MVLRIVTVRIQSKDESNLKTSPQQFTTAWDSLHRRKFTTSFLALWLSAKGHRSAQFFKKRCPSRESLANPNEVRLGSSPRVAKP
jgi:hypothetical protein